MGDQKQTKSKKTANFEAEEEQSIAFEEGFGQDEQKIQEAQVLGTEPQAPSTEQQATSAEAQVLGTEPQATSAEAQVLGTEPQATSAEPQEEKKIDEDDFWETLSPVQEVEKPQSFEPKTPEEVAYAKEHAGLPITEERPEKEVLIEEQELLNERAEANKEIENQEQDTLAQATALQTLQQEKPEELIEVEGVLQQGLEEDFKKMTPEQQEAFKLKGEETASKIVMLLKSTKVQLLKVLNLIKAWLNLIPGINKYYLNQQSKIKTDELLKLKKERGEVFEKK